MILHKYLLSSKKIVGATALASLMLAGTAQANLIDLTNTVSTSGIAPALSANSALLTATSSATYSVANAISFDWFFNANDYLPYDDYGWFNAGSGDTVLASVASVGNYGDSGWQTYTFASAYTGNLIFGATNDGDSFLSSTLEIQDLSVSVPGPSSWSLLSLGIIGLGLCKKRKASS